MATVMLDSVGDILMLEQDDYAKGFTFWYYIDGRNAQICHQQPKRVMKPYIGSNIRGGSVTNMDVAFKLAHF